MCIRDSHGRVRAGGRAVGDDLRAFVHVQEITHAVAGAMAVFLSLIHILQIHDRLKTRGKSADDIASITIRTHEACIRIIDKKGPLNNPADRDHCIQYMVACLLYTSRCV